MKKSILSLGVLIKKSEQKMINGGTTIVFTPRGPGSGSLLNTDEGECSTDSDCPPHYMCLNSDTCVWDYSDDELNSNR